MTALDSVYFHIKITLSTTLCCSITGTQNTTHKGWCL